MPFLLNLLLVTLPNTQYITAAVGTPTNIPINPKALPPIIIASITHKDDNPTDPPTTLG